MATLTPVDYDPFAGDQAQQAQGGGALVPVDHDPFTDEKALTQAKASRDWWRKGGEALNAPDSPPSLSEYPDPLASVDLLRNIARGQFFGSYLDEGLAGASAAAHKLTGGKAGSPYDEAVAYHRAWNKLSDEENPVAGTVTRVAGGLAGGAPLAKPILSGGNWLWKATKGAGLGGAYSYLYGSGEAEGGLGERHEKGLEAAGPGALLGFALPPALKGSTWLGGKLRDLAAPKLAQLKADITAMPKEMGFPSMSADGAIPESAGARAGGQQMMADTLLREGTTIPELEAQMASAERSSLFQGGGQRGNPGASYAQNVLAPVDLSPGLQRLAGSAVRASTEAGKYAATFHGARQTGITPQTGPLPPEMGLPTRPLLARPDPDMPMGQQERLLDAPKRALLIEDAGHHGHAATAYKTEQQIIEEARTAAQPAYNAVYKAGGMTDLAPQVNSVLQEWAPGGAKLANESQPVVDKVQQIAKLFQPGGSGILNIERFDRTKRYVDGDIDRYFNSQEGRNNHLGGVLSDLKNELLAAVDGIKTNGVGSAYAAARSEFSDAMGMRDALRAGGNVFKENSEVGADQFKAFAKEPGKQNLFKLGFHGSLANYMGDRKLSNDMTQIFQKPRIQGLLQAMIPRTETPTGRVKIVSGKPAVYSDRPERLGNYISNEQRMVASGANVFGNSKTAERIADDEAYNVLGSIADRIKEGAQMASGGGGDVWMRMFDWGKALLIGKNFGMPADRAASIIRQLYTADPAQRAKVFAEVKMRMGNNRYERFRQLMAEHNAQILRTGAIQGAQGNEE